MAEITLDQQRALALASARTRASQTQDASGAAGSSGAAPITLNDAVNAIARGVPVIGSGLDELDAATNATISPLIPGWLAAAIPGDAWKQRYLASLATIRGNDQAFDAARPSTSFGLRLLGGAATGGAAMSVAPRVTQSVLGILDSSIPMWLRSLRGASSGAALAGLHGFGEGQDNLRTRIGNAGLSALVGLGVGAAIPPIGEMEAKELADYLGSDAAEEPAREASETSLSAGGASLPPPTVLQHMLGAAGGAMPALSGRRRRKAE